MKWLNKFVAAAIISLAFLVLGGEGNASDNQQDEKLILKDVITVPEGERRHLAPGEKWEYESFPPTTGPHSPIRVEPGFYDIPQLAERLVESLEYGIIVIYYDEPSLKTLNQLKELAVMYPGRYDGVIVTPAKGLKGSVVLTAWTRTLHLDSFELNLTEAFIKAFRKQGPYN